MLQFTKQHRLKNKNDYSQVFKTGNKIVSPAFIMYYCKNTKGRARLGLALSKKNIPLAHQRNRLKRILRESFRCQELPALDVVFIAKIKADKVRNDALNQELSLIWKKLITICAD